LQEDLNFVQEHWNTHRIRKSKYQTLSGRPNTLYHLPEQSGTIDYKQVVPVEKFNYVSAHVVIGDYTTEYTEYFNFLLSSTSLTKPNNWQEALDLYNMIISANEDV
jgi:hypothetical protein